MDIDLTDEERLGAQQAMLESAYAALGEFPSGVDDANEGEDRDEIARRVIWALVAASAVCEAEKERLRDGRDGYLYLLADPSDAVATAFACWMNSEELGDAVANSFSGSRLLAFAQGLAAAQHIQDAFDLLQDGSGFAFAADGAARIVEQIDE